VEVLITFPDYTLTDILPSIKSYKLAPDVTYLLFVNTRGPLIIQIAKISGFFLLLI
jgi:hypothetical protein